MTDFDFDCKEKKAIARGAFHKKNGSKSKGCHLPSDDLSAAQRKKLNGPCKMINLDRPMTRKEFEELSFSLQDMYLKHIVELYDPSVKELRSMLKCDTSYITRIKKEHNISGHKFGGYNKHPKGHAEMWAAFCNGVVGGGTGKKSSDSIIPPAKLDEQRGWVTEGDAQELGIDLGDIPEKDADGKIKLDFNIPPTVVEVANEADEKEQQKTLDQIRFERDFYKARYFELLAIVGEWRSK